MDLTNFYSAKKRLDYNPIKSSPRRRIGLKKLIAYDDRFDKVNQELITLLGKFNRSGIKILDVGVGDGVYESQLPSGIRSELEIYGIDISEKQLKRSKKYLKQVNIVDLNKESIPFKNNYFDLIILSEILEHVFYPEKVLTEAIRVLKEGGFLLLTYPNSGAFQLRLALFFSGRSPLLNYPQNLEHIRFFSKSDLLTMTENKLELIKYQGLASLLFDGWNFPISFKFYVPRFLQVFFNKFFPGLALGNLLIFKK